MMPIEVELLLGPSGAGKSTVARLLSSANAGHVLFVGDKCRQLASENRFSTTDMAATGNGIALSVEAINLALDELTHHIPLSGKPVFIDGPPRNREQAQLLAKRFRMRTIYRFLVPDDVLIARIIDRYRNQHRSDDLPDRAITKISAFRIQEPRILDELRGTPIVEISHTSTPEAVLATILSRQP